MRHGMAMLHCMECSVPQVYCSIPPSVEKEERRLLEETVAQECCPETVWRIKETGAQVVSRGMGK